MTFDVMIVLWLKFRLRLTNLNHCIQTGELRSLTKLNPIAFGRTSCKDSGIFECKIRGITAWISIFSWDEANAWPQKASNIVHELYEETIWSSYACFGACHLWSLSLWWNELHEDSSRVPRNITIIRVWKSRRKFHFRVNYVYSHLLVLFNVRENVGNVDERPQFADGRWHCTA